MKRNLLIAASTLLCILTFFTMHQAALVTSISLTPPQSASGMTPEGIVFTETIDGPSTCPLNTRCEWTIIIQIENQNEGYQTFTEINVTERLGAELAIDENGPIVAPIVTPPSPLIWDWGFSIIGNSFKYSVWWYIETLAPNIPIIFQHKIWTDENPAKVPKQEYTECGTHQLNSGPVLDYAEVPGKYSDWGWVWYIEVPCAGVPLFSDAFQILPIAILAGTLVVVVLRRRR